MSIWLTALSLITHQTALLTPYAQTYPTKVEPPKLPSLERMKVAEFRVDATGTFSNPFDPTDVQLELQVEGPKTKYTVPGFWFADYKRELRNGKEELTRAGEFGWRVRWSPKASGAHRIRIWFKDQRDVFTTPWKDVNVAESDQPGVIRVSQDTRYFAYENGNAYFPIGANTCWGGDRGTFSFDDWFPKYGKAGANFGRLWLSPEWTTFALEKKGKAADGAGMGLFDLGNAWRIDYVMRLAAEHGLNLKLCIDSYNILRNRDAYNYWEQTPHNQDHGGPLRIWRDFWTDSRMERLYRAKLRYLVARYGAYPNLFAWEFWNEVDLVSEFDDRDVRRWHQQQGAFLRSLDPYKHLITTSFSGTAGVRDIDAIPELDFIQTHNYNSPDIVGTIINQQVRKISLGKPHYVGEIGADGGSPRREEDPNGLQIHDPLWASVTTGGSGAAMPWWWDSYIEPNDLYGLFSGIAKFTEGVDFPKEEFRTNRLATTHQEPQKAPSFRDLSLLGPESWEKAPQNQPQSIRIGPNGEVKGNLPVSGLLHGTRNHPELHNPLTIFTQFKSRKTFEISIRSVSGYGGASAEVMLDGVRVAFKDFPMPEDAAEGQSTNKYNGTLTVSIPSGEHSIVVRNPGKDWFRVSYRIKDAIPDRTPGIEAWGITGRTKCLIWMRPSRRTWSAVIEQKQVRHPVPASYISLSGLAGGNWEVQYWDTWTGRPTRSSNIAVPANGKLRLAVPSFDRDLAVRLNRR
jgi:hypothetical protein